MDLDSDTLLPSELIGGEISRLVSVAFFSLLGAFCFCALRVWLSCFPVYEVLMVLTANIESADVFAQWLITLANEVRRNSASSDLPNPAALGRVLLEWKMDSYAMPVSSGAPRRVLHFPSFNQYALSMTEPLLRPIHRRVSHLNNALSLQSHSLYSIDIICKFIMRSICLPSASNISGRMFTSCDTAIPQPICG